MSPHPRTPQQRDRRFARARRLTQAVFVGAGVVSATLVGFVAANAKAGTTTTVAPTSDPTATTATTVPSTPTKASSSPATTTPTTATVTTTTVCTTTPSGIVTCY